MKTWFPFLLICLFGKIATAQYLFEGQINNDRWQNEVYLSIVEDYRSLDGVFDEQIISKVNTDSTGRFRFVGSQLNNENRIYKLHVDNCSEFDRDSAHSFGHCEDSHDIVFIAKNTDTIRFPLSFDAQMFCDISSTNEKTDALLKIDSLKERMKFAYGEFRSEASRNLNNRKWFEILHDFSKTQNEPLAQLYVYAFLSDRTSNFHPYYLKNVKEDGFYDHLLADLKNKYPESSFTKQYESELMADRFSGVAKGGQLIASWPFIIVFMLLLISLFFNFKLYRKTTHAPVVNPIDRRGHLTQQEQTILELILDNKSNKDIAETLFISVSTVKTHINNIYKKFQVTSRDQIKKLFIK